MRALWIGYVALIGGCMTDGNGNTCAWVPGDDGHCPSDSGGGGGDSTFHWVSGGAAASIGDQLRVVWRTSEGDDARIETLTLDAPVVSPVMLDEAPLDGYCRLRVGGYRTVFAYAKRQTIECIFAEQRSLVYEMLLERLRDRLRRGGE